MAHALLTKRDGGAAAVIGATGLMLVNDQKAYARLLHQFLAQDGLSIGEALTKSKQLFKKQSPDSANVQLGINLLGDPTLSF